MGITSVVTQTVVQELAHYVDNCNEVRKQRAATIALSSMLEWGIQPVGLKPVGNGICDVVANVIASRRLLPEDERNDAYIFIEASFYQAAMLITWDRHLLEAPLSALNEVVRSFDLPAVQICHPKVILGY